MRLLYAFQTAALSLFLLYQSSAFAHTRAASIQIKIVQQGIGAIVLPDALLTLQADGFDPSNALRVRTPWIQVRSDQLNTCLASGLWRQHEGSILYIQCPPTALGLMQAHPYVLQRTRALFHGSAHNCTNANTSALPFSKDAHHGSVDPFADNSTPSALAACLDFPAGQFALLLDGQPITWKIQLQHVTHSPKVWSSAP